MLAETPPPPPLRDCDATLRPLTLFNPYVVKRHLICLAGVKLRNQANGCRHGQLRSHFHRDESHVRHSPGSPDLTIPASLRGVESRHCYQRNGSAEPIRSAAERSENAEWAPQSIGHREHHLHACKAAMVTPHMYNNVIVRTAV